MIAARGLILLSSVLNRVALWGAVTAVAVMVAAALWQVVARYILASPPVWTEELARYAMVWAGMLGASCAFHDKADPVLFPAALDMTGPKGVIAAIVRAVAVACFAGPVLWFCLVGANGSFARGYIGRSLERQADMLAIPMVWVAVAIPVAFSLICLHALAGIAAKLMPPPAVRQGSP